jgi:hypothetical protein
VLAATAALASAATAAAAYNPMLQAFEDQDNGTTDISFVQTTADDPTAKIQFYSPAGFTISTTQAVGTRIGTVDGQVFAAGLAGATVPVTGAVAVADPTSPTLQGLSMQCTGTKTHTAYWVATVAASGNSLAVPVFVDVATTAFSSSSLSLCFLPPSQVTLGIHLLEATLHLKDVFGPPAAGGEFRWTAVATPFAGDMPNPAGTVEMQATDHQPIQVALSGKRVTKTTFKGRGKHRKKHHTYFASLVAAANTGGVPQEGATVDFMVGTKKVASGTTNTKGQVKRTLKLTKTTSYTAHVKLESSGPISGATCSPQLPFPGTSVLIPCASVTNVGFSATSSPKRIVKPKH